MTEIPITSTPGREGSADAASSAWWMYDNHTFRKLDLNGDWRGDAMACFDADPCGSFFVRNANDREIFSLHVHGRAKRNEFIAGLAAWSPQNTKRTSTLQHEKIKRLEKAGTEIIEAARRSLPRPHPTIERNAKLFISENTEPSRQPTPTENSL